MQGVELRRILRVSALKEDFELNAYTYKHAKHETALDLRVHDLTDRLAYICRIHARFSGKPCTMSGPHSGESGTLSST